MCTRLARCAQLSRGPAVGADVRSRSVNRPLLALDGLRSTKLLLLLPLVRSHRILDELLPLLAATPLPCSAFLLPCSALALSSRANRKLKVDD